MLSLSQHGTEAQLSMARAEQDVVDGNLLQASNQAWHAAKHAVNAAAVSRNRSPVQYAAKRRFIDELVVEPGNTDLKRWFAYPWNLHGNADQGFLPDAAVGESARMTRQLVNRLLTLAHEEIHGTATHQLQ